jgi:hypothetical protein
MSTDSISPLRQRMIGASTTAIPSAPPAADQPTAALWPCINTAAGREPHVRYHVERFREKWAIARESVRTYWGWDEFITRGSDGTLS